MKNKIIYALVLVVILIISSCSASSPILHTNSDLQSEVEEMRNKGGSVITPPPNNNDCSNGHTGIYTAGDHGCIKVCNRCGEVLGDEIPHTPERAPRGYIVIGNISYEQIYLTCKKCRVLYEKEYIPFDVRSRK